MNPQQMLFGINQGAIYPDLRIWHMPKQIAKLPCDGYAIGGLAVGEPTETMYEIIGCCGALSAPGQASVSHGRGHPLATSSRGSARGVDFFDCVMPARNARHGKLFTWKGVINIKNEKYKLDDQPHRSRLPAALPAAEPLPRLPAPSVQGGGDAGHALGGDCTTCSSTTT